MKKNGRHELKHYISFADCLQLNARLPQIAGYDKNSNENGCYRVRSLYFDNYNDKALFEKLDGVDVREKFRLRLYNGDTSFIRLEKKSKVFGLCYKQSAEISKDECERLLSGEIDVLKKNGEPLCIELYAKMKFQVLRPRSLVEYKRQAYIYNPGNVRVTIDSEIRASANIHDFLSKSPVMAQADSSFILEIKYDEFLPEIMRRATTLSSRQPTAFSKYAVARML